MMCGDCERTLATSAGDEAVAEVTLEPGALLDASTAPGACAEALETCVTDGDCMAGETGVTDEIQNSARYCRQR